MAKNGGHPTGRGPSLPKPTKISGGGKSVIQPSRDAGGMPGAGSSKKSDQHKDGKRGPW